VRRSGGKPQPPVHIGPEFQKELNCWIGLQDFGKGGLLLGSLLGGSGGNDMLGSPLGGMGGRGVGGRNQGGPGPGGLNMGGPALHQKKRRLTI
jgi:hypothetical protein